MKHFYSVILASMVSVTSMAQTTVVNGVLKDSVRNETEPFATVRVFKSANMQKPVAMSLTDADGNIKQEIKGRGEYTITFNSVGKREIKRKLSLNGQPSISLGDVNTCDDANSLAAVEVVAQKPLVKMETDKMSYSVEDDVDAKASTVLDMLRKVPMVTVDGQDNITVNGSSSFKVYVNDKPSQMFKNNPGQIFKSMPASSVKSIEVVTNPGARYDAEGAGGILNIVMASENGKKQSLNGYNGSISAKGSNRGGGASAFISGQQGKFSYSANATYNYEQYKDSYISSHRTQADGSNIDYAQTSSVKNPFAMGDISIGYELDSMSNINANASFSYWNNKVKGDPYTTMYGGAYGNGFGYGTHMTQDIPSTSFDGSIDYQRYFNAKRTSYMILSYLFTSNPSKEDYYRYYYDVDSDVPLTLNDLRSKEKDNETEHTVQADFTTQLSDNHKLNYGAKFIYRRNSSDSKYYNIAADGTETIDPDNSINYCNTQRILAAYSEWDGSFGKMSAKTGLRYEHTFEKIDFADNKDQNYSKDYGTLVPNATLSFSPSQTSNLGLSYNMRISRPGISYLNPFVERTNPTSISYGNTNLEVEKSHNMKFVFNYFTSKVMVSANIGQSFCNNEIAQYSFVDNDDILNLTYGNIVKNRQTSLSLYFNWALHKNTRLTFSGSGSYVDMRSTQLDERNHGWQGNGYLGLQQTLPWKMQFGLGAFANSRSYNIQGYNGSMAMAFGTLSKDFCNEHLNLAINFVTPFTDRMEIKQYSHGSNFTNCTDVKIPIRKIGLTVTYKFGNTKKQFQQHQSNISNDFSNKQSGGQSIGGASMGGGM